MIFFYRKNVLHSFMSQIFLDLQLFPPKKIIDLRAFQLPLKVSVGIYNNDRCIFFLRGKQKNYKLNFFQQHRLQNNYLSVFCFWSLFLTYTFRYTAVWSSDIRPYNAPDMYIILNKMPFSYFLYCEFIVKFHVFGSPVKFHIL